MNSRSQLTYWHSTLQGKSLPIHENDPQEGWYRTRPRKGYRSLPVRIWRDEGSGELLALRDGKRVDPFEVWTWVCLNPVSVEAYEDVLERGGRWPDDITSGPRLDQLIGSGTATGRSVARRNRSSDTVRSAVQPSCSQIGHNSAHAQSKVDDRLLDGALADEGAQTAEALTHAIASLWNEVSDWLTGLGEIADQVTADRCANFADAFASFEKQAEELRTTTKKPVLDEGRAIDAHWKPVVSAAEDAKRRCKKALEPFLIAETERLEREFMEQLRAKNGDLSVLSSLSITAKAGTFGRTISLRRVRKIRVLDRRALLVHYHRDARFVNDEAVQKALAKLAEQDLQARLSVPGAESVEEKVAA